MLRSEESPVACYNCVLLTAVRILSR